MSINVDARGLACPQPVIATKKALESITDGIVTVIVDNAAAKENVTKFAAANNCGSSVEEQGGHYYLTITKGAGEISDRPVSPAAGNSLVYLITQETLGHGSSELGTVLIKSFFYTLREKEPLPKTVMFLNSGVKLAVENSPVLEHLQALAGSGVQVLSCGTCLDYYGLKEKLAVGAVTNMYAIVDELSGADRAITL